MAAETTTPAPYGSEDAVGGEKYDAPYWQEQIQQSETELCNFHRDGVRAYRRYLDNREDSDAVYTQAPFRYNLFWANTQILKTSLYSQPPRPMVTRRWDDPMDDVSRVASIIIQRILMIGTNQPENDMHVAFTNAVLDRLVAGWGQVWLRFEPTVEQVETPSPMPGQPPISAPQLVDVEIPIDYVAWRDFLYSPARTWAEVTWVARREPMIKEEITKRFGTEKANSLQYQGCKPKELEPKGDMQKTVYVYEIWCKKTHMVHWLAEDKILDEKPDPLQVEGFYPCPKPLMSTFGTSSLIPSSDYMQCRYQYDELDVINTRINLLADALKVIGMFDESSKELANVLTQGIENRMIPVSNWAMFAEKGGMKGVVDWFPVEQVVAVYGQMRVARTDLVGQIYELTGISDIMRGISQPRETAKTSELKAQYSSGRLMNYQLEVAGFVEQVMRIKANIAANHMPPELMVKKTNILASGQDQQMVQQAVMLIKDKSSLYWNIKIQADTLGMPDYSNEKEARVEFLTTTGQFLSQSQSLMEASPEAAPYLLKMIQWVAAGFRSGYTVEQYLDEAIRAAEEKLKEPPPEPPPDPKLLQIEAQAKADAATLQMEGQQKQQETMAKMSESQQQMQQEMIKFQAEMRQASQLHGYKVIEEQLKIVMQKLKIQEAREQPEPTGGSSAR